MIKYPLRTDLWRLIGISNDKPYELYLWHDGKEVEIKDNDMKEKLLEYLSGKYTRETSDYIMKSAGVSWILRIKYNDNIKSIIIYGNIKKIKYESLHNLLLIIFQHHYYNLYMININKVRIKNRQVVCFFILIRSVPFYVFKIFSLIDEDKLLVYLFDFKQFVDNIAENKEVNCF
ncbi:hypothetical protein Cphy_1947 [Lachnoclostridium phytofermentans ISDg]|uniref:Uncharacterized protein n=1 Tax=Lachnoclostridium phytofermentans (strain ATCC 700394 / DSM 18823 / ISDg) TaxID=357809 RepID=A9KHN0_LACP7|nr:hypothetical protein Cphy_1947 [Lachnoclostridium phytofermentans ISDg]